MLALPLAACTRSAERCAFLGDRLGGGADPDTFHLSGSPGEWLHISVSRSLDPRNEGEGIRLGLARSEGRGAKGRPLGLSEAIEGTVPGSGETRIRIESDGYRGAYCLRVESAGTAADTLAPEGDVEVPWVALSTQAGNLPPFVRESEGVFDGRVQPERPLEGARVYGLILTNAILGSDGAPLQASDAFRAAKGTAEPDSGGPVALWSADPEEAANPYPDPRLVRPDGSVHIPDRFVLRGLDPSDPGVAQARTNLRRRADQLEDLTGFGTLTPLRVALSGDVDLGTVTPESLLLFERTDGDLDLEGLLAEAARHGVPAEDVVLALSFPTQPIGVDLRAIRSRQLELAAADAFAVSLDPADPSALLPRCSLGPPIPPGTTVADFLSAHPEVGTVVTGLLPSPDFRDENGFFDPERVAGDVAAPLVPLDFVSTLPPGPGPHPVVILQHGFAGCNDIVLDLGPELAARGLAAIGISALSHGSRGNPTELVTSTPAGARDIFRQTNADQMALVRGIEAGIDVDGDGVADLDPDAIHYLGISLGGLLGGVVTAVEDRIVASVLNVTGGRVGRLGEAPSVAAIYQLVAAAFAGLPLASPEFQVYNARLLELGDLAESPADALSYARRWKRRPYPGAPPRRVLIQEGVGDDLVLNVLTEELARVAGYEPNVPRSDPSGVSGHWIFEPPGGHGIFGREDVRKQAYRFLESAGTVIEDPQLTLP